MKPESDREPLSTLRRRLARVLRAAAIAGVLLCAAAALFVEGWPARRYLLLYLAPLVGAVALWLRCRVLERRTWPPAALTVDAAVVMLAALRLPGALTPVSGHMLFLAHSGLTTASTGYRWLALALVLETSYFKLVLWDDPRSWGLGLACGLLAARLHRRASAPS